MFSGVQNRVASNQNQWLWEFLSPCFMGLKIADLNHLDFHFHFLSPASLRIEARFWATFRSLQIGIVSYVRLLCLIIWNKKRVACSWKRYRLIEKRVLLPLVISRSSWWHTTNIICWSVRTACCITYGHVAQGPRLVSGHGPFRGTAFLWSLTRELS